MILYHPVKDVNHCIYRTLAILLHIERPFKVEHFRLLDFYYCFPHLMKEIKPWPGDIKEYKKYISKVPDSYEKISNKKRLFFEMTQVQKTSLAILHAKGMIMNDEYRLGNILLDRTAVPKQLISVIEEDEFVNSEIFKTLTEGLMNTVWEGKTGLKFRTGLLEYKYDE